MLLSAIKENDNNETRVSISPESVKLFSRLGFEVIIENGAGETSGYQNSNYEEAGAKIVTRSECLKADVCLCVRMPSTVDINNLKKLLKNRIFTDEHEKKNKMLHINLSRDNDIIVVKIELSRLPYSSIYIVVFNFVHDVIDFFHISISYTHVFA